VIRQERGGETACLESSWWRRRYRGTQFTESVVPRLILHDPHQRCVCAPRPHGLLEAAGLGDVPSAVAGSREALALLSGMGA
jgi:hypothetical protein